MGFDDQERYLAMARLFHEIDQTQAACEEHEVIANALVERAKANAIEADAIWKGLADLQESQARIVATNQRFHSQLDAMGAPPAPHDLDYSS